MSTGSTPQSPVSAGLPPGVRLNDAEGILTLTNANTTLGYCRYDATGQIEYVFVNPAWRRQGLGRLLLGLVRERLGGVALEFQAPISPLGARLIEAYRRQG